MAFFSIFYCIISSPTTIFFLKIPAFLVLLNTSGYSDLTKQKDYLSTSWELWIKAELIIIVLFNYNHTVI